jgi:hypothetical protein
VIIEIYRPRNLLSSNFGDLCVAFNDLVITETHHCLPFRLSAFICPLLDVFGIKGIIIMNLFQRIMHCYKPLLKKTKLNSMVCVREPTILTERPLLVGEVIANCFVIEVATWSS